MDSTDRVRELEGKLYLTIDAITTAGDSGHDPRGGFRQECLGRGLLNDPRGILISEKQLDGVQTGRT